MKVHYGTSSFTNNYNAVVTSGTYDGVHFGHQKILGRLTEIAKAVNGESVVITFWPHPRLVLRKDKSIELLSTLEEKISLLESFGIDHLIVIPFDKEFSSLTSEEFIQKIVIKAVGTKKLVIGYDHRFGKNREGSFEYLRQNSKRLGFDVEEIPKQEIDAIAVSSTKIRRALNEGDIFTANHYLDRPYEISGKVIEGNKIGRTIDFPTANLEIDSPHKLIPKEGIYAVKVKVANEEFQGMLNIGFRPTIEITDKKIIEVNIFSFDKDIYGENITIYFHSFLREEKKFNGLKELQLQLKKDRKNTLAFFSGQ